MCSGKIVDSLLTENATLITLPEINEIIKPKTTGNWMKEDERFDFVAK